MRIKLAIVIPVIFFAGIAFVLAALSFNLKTKFDSVAQEYPASEVILMDSEVKARFMKEISTMQSHAIDGLSEEERTVFVVSEIPINTEGFVYFLSSDTPSYHFWRMNRNRLNSQKLVLRSIIGPSINPNRRIYLETENGKIVRAFSRSHSDSIVETRDHEEGGFVHILHYYPSDQPEVEPGAGLNSESLRSSP